MPCTGEVVSLSPRKLETVCTFLECIIAKSFDTGLDIATCGVATATTFYSVATKFPRLVANLAPKIGDFLLWEKRTLMIICALTISSNTLTNCSYDLTVGPSNVWLLLERGLCKQKLGASWHQDFFLKVEHCDNLTFLEITLNLQCYMYM